MLIKGLSYALIANSGLGVLATTFSASIGIISIAAAALTIVVGAGIIIMGNEMLKIAVKAKA